MFSTNTTKCVCVFMCVFWGNNLIQKPRNSQTIYQRWNKKTKQKIKRRKCKHVLHEINGIFLFSTKLIYFYIYFPHFFYILHYNSIICCSFSFSRKALQCIRLHLVFLCFFFLFLFHCKKRNLFQKNISQKINKLSVSMKFNLGFIHHWGMDSLWSIFSTIFCLFFFVHVLLAIKLI